MRRGIKLVIGEDATVDFTLQVGGVSEQVVVNGDAPPVNVATTDISGLVGEQQVEEAAA